VTPDHDAAELEARFESAFERDRALLGFFDRATLVASLLTVAVLLTLVIPMGRMSIWLSGLTFYGAGTRLGVFIARYALTVPLFLLELDSTDSRSRAAARAVFERNREALGKALLTHGNHRPSEQEIRDLDPDEAAALARSREIPTRRRTALVCAALWVIVSIVVWTAVFVTGGGPTSLTGGR
jgi:hypothetical protein